ncbi:MAG: hypothetical protein LBT46_04025 [Planctomycetaceae bacterium]|nr:hypothetical protein [Planctomycetaceae bacterium]
MSDTICGRAESEVFEREKDTAKSRLYQKYKKFSEMYEELIEKGVTSRRLSQMRSISDPPPPDNSPLYRRF